MNTSVLMMIMLAQPSGIPPSVDAAETVAINNQSPTNQASFHDGVTVRLEPLFEQVGVHRKVPYRVVVHNEGVASDAQVKICASACEDSAPSYGDQSLYWTDVYGISLNVVHGAETIFIRLDDVFVDAAVTPAIVLEGESLPLGTIDGSALLQYPAAIDCFTRIMIGRDVHVAFHQRLKAWKHNGVVLDEEAFAALNSRRVETIQEATGGFLQERNVRTLPLGMISLWFLIGGLMGMGLYWGLRKDAKKQWVALTGFATVNTFLIIGVTHFLHPANTEKVEILLQTSDATSVLITAQNERPARFFGKKRRKTVARATIYNQSIHGHRCEVESYGADLLGCNGLTDSVTVASRDFAEALGIRFVGNTVQIKDFPHRPLAAMRGQGYAKYKGHDTLIFDEHSYDDRIDSSLTNFAGNLTSEGFKVVIGEKADGTPVFWGSL